MFQTWHQPGKIINRKSVYTGRVFSVDQLHIETPDGLRVERDLIKTAPTITILGLNFLVLMEIINASFFIQNK